MVVCVAGFSAVAGVVVVVVVVVVLPAGLIAQLANIMVMKRAKTRVLIDTSNWLDAVKKPMELGQLYYHLYCFVKSTLSSHSLGGIMQPMDSHFDTKSEDAKLTQIREGEEEDVVRILSDKYGLTYADLSLKEIDTDALRTVPEEEARLAETAVFAKTAKELSLAVHNPNNPALAKLREELVGRGFHLKEFLVSKKSLERALSRYGDISYAAESKAGVFTVPPETLEKLTSGSQTKSALSAQLDAAVALA